MKSSISSRSFYLVIITFILLSVLGQVSTGIYTPFFQELATLHSSGIGMIEKSVAIFLIAFSVSQLLSGVACDYLNKTRLLQAGLLLFMLGTLLVALANTPQVFLAGRIIQGLGGGVGVSVTRALSKQLFSPQQLNVSLSLTNIAFAIAPAVAPLIGTLVGHYAGITAIFGIVLCLALLAFWLLFYIAPQLNSQHKPRSLHVISVTLALMRTCLPRILLVGVASGLLYGIVFGFVTVSPSLLMDEHHFSKTAFSLFSLLATLCFVLGSYLNIRLPTVSAVYKFKLSGLIILGLSCCTLLWLTTMSSNTLWGTLLLGYLAFFFAGIAMPCSVSLMLSFSNTSAGFLAALVGFFHLSGASIGAYLVATINMPPALTFVMVTTLLSFCSVMACAVVHPAHNEQD